MKLTLRRSYSSVRSVALLILAALTPLVVLATLVVPYYQRSEQQELDAQLQRSADRAALAVSRELYTQVQLLTVLAESPRLDDPLDVEGFLVIADRLRNRLPDWSSIRVSALDGTILVASPPPKVPTTTVVDPASHRKVVETGQVAIGDMLVGPGGSSGFAVRVPIVRNDQVAYVLSAVIREVTLKGSLESTALQSGWLSRIVSDDGKVIAGEKIAADGPTVSSSGGTAWASGFDAGLYRTKDAVIEGTGWHVVVGMPLSIYRASETIGLAVVLGSGTVAVILALLAAVLLKRELAYRKRQAEIVASGHRFDALSKLAGGLSHDFNNLLMSFQSGLDQLVRRRADQAKFDHIVGLMRESVEKGKTSVQRLSGFTRRSDTGSEVMRFQDRFADLVSLVRQTVRDDILLDSNIDPHTWPIKVDPQALEIALVNLASNAQDAMGNGGRLAISIANAALAEQLGHGLRGPHVHITLSDTGSGISAENLNRVFDPFFTTKGSTAAGLGLSQVYSFAKRSGGTAFAASVPGRGTAIHLLLPAASLEVATGAMVLRPIHELVVLVVDDDPIVAQGVAAFLDGQVARVDVAYSALDGLQKLLSKEFGALVTDITMPGMSGIDFAAQAARLHPELQIVLMTGYSDQLERGAATAFPVLAKPFQQGTLLKTLSERTRPDNVIPISRSR